MTIYNSFETANWNRYEFVLNSYTGEGGYIDGSYLFPHTRELDFESRRKQSYYKNFVKGILDSIITPVFAQKALRESNNDLFNAFIENVDVNNTHLQDFSQNAITMARLLGNVFIVMDNFSDVPSTKKQAIDERLFPYIYMKLPQDVYSFKIDKFNRLTEISFFMEENEDGEREYVYWDSTIYRRYRIHNGEYKTITEIEHGFGRIPVIQVNTSETKEILPQPPLYDLCRVALTIYNQDSEQRDLERIQSFSVLVVPGTQPDQNVEIGSHNLIFIENDASQSPKYIAPDPQVLSTVRTSSEHNVQALIKIANVLGASAVDTGNSTKSGVAMSYSFLGSNYQLMRTAGMATDLEDDIAELFSLFIGEEVEYKVMYKSEYTPTPTAVKQKLDILTTISDNFDEYITPEQKVSIGDSIATMINYATSV